MSCELFKESPHMETCPFISLYKKKLNYISSSCGDEKVLVSCSEILILRATSSGIRKQKKR